MAWSGVGFSGAGGGATKAFIQGRVMRRATGCEQWRNGAGSAGGDIGSTEIAAVGKQGLRPAEIGGQRRQQAQHWLELLLVVGGLHDIGGDHQQAVGRHRGLRVLALLEPTAGHRHNPRVLVGQI
jgi:hypothetical protein